MRTRSFLALAAVAVIGAGLSGCGTVSKLNPIHKKETNKVKASQGERIPLLAYNSQLSVSDALKGQPFFLPDPQAVESWPLPGGTNDQWTPNLAAGADFKVVWRKDFGEASNRAKHVTAPPIAADGKVFVMDADANVSAMDAKSGARLWRQSLAEKTKRDRISFGGGIAYDGGHIYVTSGYRFVAAIDAATGKLIWRTKVDSPIHGAPTVTDGKVIAVNVDDELESFDTATGAQGWTYQALTEPARILAASSPVASGGTVVAAFASGELAALRTANGNEEWTATLSRTNRTNALSEIRDIAGRPVIYNGDVLAGSHSGVFMVTDLRTGAPRWNLPVTSITTPWPAGDVVFLVSQAGEVICASRENGQVYWITELNKDPKKKKKKSKKQRTLYFGPVLASGRLIVVSDEGKAVALDPQTGAVKSTIALGGPALIPPIGVNGTLFVVTDKATLVAIR